jgi:hypothetical protein
MQKRVEDILKKVAQDNSLPEYIVKAIMESQFQCAREAVKKGESGNPATFLNIRFRHLGLLVAKPGKINKLHALRQAKEEKDSE